MFANLTETDALRMQAVAALRAASDDGVDCPYADLAADVEAGRSAGPLFGPEDVIAAVREWATEARALIAEFTEAHGLGAVDDKHFVREVARCGEGRKDGPDPADAGCRVRVGVAGEKCVKHGGRW